MLTLNLLAAPHMHPFSHHSLMLTQKKYPYAATMVDSIHRVPTFKLVGDNIDKTVRPSHMTSEAQTQTPLF